MDDRLRALDVVLDAPASVTVYLDALEQAGRAEAGIVHAVHGSAAHAAAEVLARTGLWTARAELAVPAPFRYDPADLRPDVIAHKQSGSLHAHLVLPDGEQFDRETIRRALPLVRSHYELQLLDGLTDELGLSVSDADGHTQLAGVPDALLCQVRPTSCRVQPGGAQLRLPTPTS